MAVINRRTFLKGAAATGGAAALTGGPFAGFIARVGAVSTVDLGPLMPVPDLRDGKVRLHLPAGLQYRSFHDTDVGAGNPPITLDDGSILTGRHDGMASFVGSNGNTILVRNHEHNGPGTPIGDPANAYDTAARGGCTTTVVDAEGNVQQAWTSLNGTQMNCAGGPMPWGSWISCEETVNGPDVGPDFTGVSNALLTRPHGYIFEVPSTGISDAEPIRNAGRFAHEAAAFNPEEGILYLTEDNFEFPSGYYRYIPPSNPMVAGRLEDGGTLQMLRVVGTPNAHLEAQQAMGTTYNVDWVDIDDPDTLFPAGTTNDEALVFVGDQGRAQGAAGFSRLEGHAFDRGVLYFTSTQGGGPAETGPENTTGYGNGQGQVWAYRPADQTLTCVFQSPPKPANAVDNPVLDFPDNVTTSPRGTLILCEDSAGDNYIRGLTRKGQLFNIALNRNKTFAGADRFGDEFAGPTFSRNGKTLYVNIQASNGLTFAIFGNWQKLGV
jgi:uncharacterized protein